MCNYDIMKRTIDFFLAVFCILLFSPLILVIYLTIKIGGGPAIYKQERIGKGGKPFFIYKFRSMIADAEEEGEALLQQDNDPRLTKIGRFLRNHHLDELPQLWNVLIGDMAFVGPRPERKFYIDQIMKHNPRYEHLYALRPGVTSYATLYNGYTDTMEKMLKRLEMDLYYLEHQSLRMDLKILWKTFVNIAFGRIFFLALCFSYQGQALAQDTLSTKITYDLTSEVSVGSGDYTAYQLVTNRHHALSTRSNTAYLRGSVNLEHALTKDIILSGSVDAIASVHADHKAYLQQCYANLTYQDFFIEAGIRENKQVVRDNILSIGSFVKGTNAKPIPQVHFGTNGFWNLPLTKQWVQINFDFGYGKFLDSDYRKDRFYQNRNLNASYITGTLYHQKHLYIRSNPTKPLFVTVGIEHAVQFGGTRYIYENGTLVSQKKDSDIKAFWDAILPVGDSNFLDHDAGIDWIYGNHVGVMTYQIGWNINRNHQIQAYLDNPFEDGSGVRKGNGWDGLWGLQYSNKSEGKQYVRGAVIEYFQSTNQSGPLHWDGGEFPEPARSQISDYIVGNDNYYNHGIYDNYGYYGMTPGIALITSPIYNKDGYSGFRDNRIKAWHLAVNGEFTNHFSYIVKGSYREGWGTYYIPLAPKHYSFDAMLQAIYSIGAWNISAAYAFDKGNIYGDNSTFNFKFVYHGKIL